MELPRSETLAMYEYARPRPWPIRRLRAWYVDRSQTHEVTFDSDGRGTLAKARELLGRMPEGIELA